MHAEALVDARAYVCTFIGAMAMCVISVLLLGVLGEHVFNCVGCDSSMRYG